MALVLPNELLVKVLEETTDADRKRASQTSRLLRQLAPWTGCRQFADIQFMEVFQNRLRIGSLQMKHFKNGYE